MTASTAKSVYSHPAAPACYDPDAAFPRESLQMSSFRPKVAPSPSPPPRIPPAGVSLALGSSRTSLASNGLLQPAPSRGDTVLLAYLNGSRPQLAARDSSHRPPQSSLSDTDSVDEPSSISCPSPSSTSGRSPGTNMPGMSPRSNESDSLDLKVLAAGALAFSTTSQGPPQLIKQSERSRVSTRDEIDAKSLSAPGEGRRRLTAPALERPLQLKDQRLMRTIPTSLRSGSDPFSMKLDIPYVQHIETVSPPSPKLTASHAQHIEPASPASPRQPGSGGLPPLQMESPTSEANGHVHGHSQALPSIRQHFSDLALSPDNRAASMARTSSFSCSPPTSLPGISEMTGFHGGRCSPPIPPSEAFRRGLPSPQSLNGFGYYYFSGSHRMPGEQGSCTADTPSSDQSSTGPSNAGVDRVSADGSVSSQPGSYVCTVSGCTAAPFQTQYLLNSHANVHSSARPHYCPVDGCPRGEGGMGFKRKNEMIRHGLVHESPGYVCPFCPDREHRYPRPDNLQRHVRVHHVDKDKDDPLLRDVLSQRPDGPSRGRRRRGVTS